MKTKNLQQEILFFTTTTLSKREWCEIELQKNITPLSPEQQLEKACWNGLLDELFPELMPNLELRKRLFLWQVYARQTFLSVEMAEFHTPAEKEFSIDPYVFLSVMSEN